MPEPRPLPLQATMGLLNYVTAHSLDEDYAHVSRRRTAERRGADPGAGGRARGGTATLVVLLAFGLLVTTAGIQTARTEPARRSSQESLAAQVRDRRETLLATRGQVLALRRDIEEARAAGLDASQAGRALQERLTRLRVATGATAVTGPGVRIVVDDAPGEDRTGQVVLDTDLQLLVNGLWASGAEAVSINGQRLTALSAIRVAGSAITVNLRSLSRPYAVSAVGDPEQLPARFLDSAAGTWWLNLRSVYDLEFAMTTEDSLTVPAAPDVALRHAEPLEAEPVEGAS